MSKLAPYAKAITAALVAGLTALLTALDDDAVSRAEWVTVAIAFLAALAAVWAIPNAQPQGFADTSPRTDGH